MNTDRIYYSHDAEMHAMRDRTMQVTLFLTFGLVIGATMALLFAPSSGRITRHDLAEGVEDGIHSSRETIEPLVKRLEEQFNELRKSVEDRLK